MPPMRRPINKVEKSMDEMNSGTLHSGGPDGPRVTNPKQAIAIGLHEQRAAALPKRRGFGKLPQ